MTDQIIYGLQIFNVAPNTNAAAAGTTPNTSMIAQIGDIIHNTVESDQAQWVQHVGFCSLPSAAIPGTSAAEALTYRGEQRDFIFASRDIASQTLYGTMTPGETAIYASGNSGKAQARILLKTDSTINLYTTDNGVDGGAGVSLTIGPQGLAFSSSYASFSIDPTGMHFSHCSGASFDIGGMPGIPGISSFFNFSGGSFVANTSTVTLGASITGLYGPCAVPLPGMSFGPLIPVIGVGMGAVNTNIAGSPVVQIAMGAG